MKAIEQMVIDELVSEYSLQEAVEQVKNAKITVTLNGLLFNIRVEYSNGKFDNYQLQPTYQMVHIPSTPTS